MTRSTFCCAHPRTYQTWRGQGNPA
jgi:hypothetical protein